MRKYTKAEQDVLKYQEYTEQLDSVNKRLTNLENKEGELFSNLQKSITEYAKLNNQVTETGN